MVLSIPARKTAPACSRQQNPQPLARTPEECPAPEIRFFDKDGAEVFRREDVNSPQALEAARKYARRLRKLNDVVVVLGLGDGPSVICMAGALHLLPFLGPVMGMADVINAATGYGSLAMDGPQAYQCLKNPKASKKDKLVDVGHVATDALNTFGSMVPLFMPLAGPLAWGLFLGLQCGGLACDLLKTRRDFKVGGEQSAPPDAASPTHMTLQTFEKRLKNWSGMLGALGIESMLRPGAAAIPGVWGGILAGLGGTMMAVGCYNDIKKGRDLVKLMKELKAEGIDSMEVPRHTKNGIVYDRASIDRVIKATHVREGISAVQGVSGMLMLGATVAAAAPGMAALAPALGIAALAIGGAGLAANIGQTLWKRRHDIAHAMSRVMHIGHRHPDEAEPDARLVSERLHHLLGYFEHLEAASKAAPAEQPGEG